MIQADHIKDIIDKAKLLNCLKEIPTACNHICYLISMSDTQHLIYIPDDVTKLNNDVFEKAFTANIRDLQGVLKVAGGKNLKDTNSMFHECKAQSLDLSNFNTSNVTDMEFMFNSCKAKFLALSSFDTSSVTNMEGMFRECQAQYIDLSTFDTSKVTNMECMFYDCQVQSLDLSSFDTSHVTCMAAMFYDCKAKSLDLSNFDTSKVTNMGFMFYKCQAQIKVTDTELLKAYQESR